MFDYSELPLQGAYLIDCFFAGDNRGGFTKCFEKDIFSDQMNLSFSLNETFFSKSMKNVIRGLHFQLHNPQTKLVTVIQGAVWDVIVDLRPSSASYGRWASVELSDKNHCAIWVPSGFAHGFLTLEDDTIMSYQCDGKYDAETDTGIIYNDPSLKINWPIEERSIILSERDKSFGSFEEYKNHPMTL